MGNRLIIYVDGPYEGAAPKISAAEKAVLVQRMNGVLLVLGGDLSRIHESGSLPLIPFVTHLRRSRVFRTFEDVDESARPNAATEAPIIVITSNVYEQVAAARKALVAEFPKAMEQAVWIIHVMDEMFFRVAMRLGEMDPPHAKLFPIWEMRPYKERYLLVPREVEIGMAERTMLAERLNKLLGRPPVQRASQAMRAPAFVPPSPPPTAPAPSPLPTPLLPPSPESLARSARARRDESEDEDEPARVIPITRRRP